MERLEYLLVISEEKNLTRAAEKLYISQPALTKYIQKLEQEYGIKLLERSHHSVELTEAGQIFLREKLKIAVLERNLRQELDAIHSKRRSIVVASGYGRTASTLVQATARFMERHPEVDVTVLARGELELLRDLSRGKCDLAFGVLGPSDGDFEMNYVSTELMGLAISRKLGLVPEDIDPWDTLKEPYLLNPDQLNGLNLIQSDTSTGAYLSYNALFSQYHIKYKQVITSNNPRVIRGLVGQGVGYGISTFSPDEPLYRGENGELMVYRCTLPGLSMQRAVMVAIRKNDAKRDLLQEYIALIREKTVKRERDRLPRK